MNASKRHDPNSKEQYIFIAGGSSAFVDMLPTDVVEEVGPTKVLLRDGNRIACLGRFGLWHILTVYKMFEGEVWTRRAA